MKYKKWLAVSVLCAVAVTGVFTGGCGKQQAAQNAQATKVTTFRPFTSDTPIVYEYTGTVAALQEVPVRARVSGTIMEKYINGGDTVTEGQPLYRIDTRQYESALPGPIRRSAGPRIRIRCPIWPGMTSSLPSTVFPVRCTIRRNL